MFESFLRDIYCSAHPDNEISDSSCLRNANAIGSRSLLLPAARCPDAGVEKTKWRVVDTVVNYDKLGAA